MSENLFSFMARTLRKKIHENEDTLGTGNAKDFAEYKFRCGVIKGYRDAIAEIQSIHEREYGDPILEDDELDDDDD